MNDAQNHVDPTQTAFLSTSPTFGGMNAGNAAAAIASVGSANQQHLLLSPGEVIRNSGKFPKPTKIPGKTYCKDEVVIRNADSGKGTYIQFQFLPRFSTFSLPIFKGRQILKKQQIYTQTKK